MGLTTGDYRIHSCYNKINGRRNVLNLDSGKVTNWTRIYTTVPDGTREQIWYYNKNRLYTEAQDSKYRNSKCLDRLDTSANYADIYDDNDAVNQELVFETVDSKKSIYRIKLANKNLYLTTNPSNASSTVGACTWQTLLTKSGEKLTQEWEKQCAIQKIVIIVLAALSAILAITVAILLFKLKDVYEDDDEEEDDEDEDDDEDEEEDDEEEEEIVERVTRRRRPAVAAERPERTERQEQAERLERTGRMEQTERPRRQAPAPAPAPRQTAKVRPAAEKERKPMPVRKVEYDPEDGFEAGQSVVQKPQPKRKAKNFLIEDDEFEFEFLNMDDKK